MVAVAGTLQSGAPLHNCLVAPGAVPAVLVVLAGPLLPAPQAMHTSDNVHAPSSPPPGLSRAVAAGAGVRALHCL